MPDACRSISRSVSLYKFMSIYPKVRVSKMPGRVSVAISAVFGGVVCVEVDGFILSGAVVVVIGSNSVMVRFGSGAKSDVRSVLYTLSMHTSFGLPLSSDLKLRSRGLLNGAGLVVTTWPWASNPRMGFSGDIDGAEFTLLTSNVSFWYVIGAVSGCISGAEAAWLVEVCDSMTVAVMADCSTWVSVVASLLEATTQVLSLVVWCVISHLTLKTVSLAPGFGVGLLISVMFLLFEMMFLIWVGGTSNGKVLGFTGLRVGLFTPLTTRNFTWLLY